MMTAKQNEQVRFFIAPAHFLRIGTAMWIGLGTRMWAGAAAKLPWSPRNAPFS